MQQGAQNALDKLRKRSPKGRRASARLSIYTYTRAPHNVNGEIALPLPKNCGDVDEWKAAARTSLLSFCHREARLRLTASSTSFTAMPDGR
jgi:hypothetical protein